MLSLFEQPFFDVDGVCHYNKQCFSIQDDIYHYKTSTKYPPRLSDLMMTRGMEIQKFMNALKFMGKLCDESNCHNQLTCKHACFTQDIIASKQKYISDTQWIFDSYYAQCFGCALPDLPMDIKLAFDFDF